MVTFSYWEMDRLAELLGRCHAVLLTNPDLDPVLLEQMNHLMFKLKVDCEEKNRGGRMSAEQEVLDYITKTGNASIQDLVEVLHWRGEEVVLAVENLVNEGVLDWFYPKPEETKVFYRRREDAQDRPPNRT